MKVEFSRFRWVTCIVTLLLLCIVGSDRPVEGAALATASSAYVAEDASGEAIISEPEDDIFTHLCSTNRLGLSSNAFHLRVLSGRTLSFSNTAQRIVRMALPYLCGHIATEQLNHTQCHTIASIRFHIGYFIYHHCQMRC